MCINNIDIELEELIEECWCCGEEFIDVVYSPTIHFLDGTKKNIEDILSDISKEALYEYEKKIKEEYENVDYVGYSELCPHCLQCI